MRGKLRLGDGTSGCLSGVLLGLSLTLFLVMARLVAADTEKWRGEGWEEVESEQGVPADTEAERCDAVGAWLE